MLKGIHFLESVADTLMIEEPGTFSARFGSVMRERPFLISISISFLKLY